jgi:hypothetical protein
MNGVVRSVDLEVIAARVASDPSQGPSLPQLIQESQDCLDKLYGLVNMGLIPMEPVQRSARELNEVLDHTRSCLLPMIRKMEAMIAGATGGGRFHA